MSCLWSLCAALAAFIVIAESCHYMNQDLGTTKYTRSTRAEDHDHHHLPEFQQSARSGSSPKKSVKCTNTAVKIRCDPSHPFRAMDGHCNNIGNPFWGASFTPLRRLVPAAYEDGESEPRGGFDTKLPNPRFISTIVHPDLIRPDPQLTNMVAQTMQFFGHDLSFSPEQNFKCCGEESTEPECWPIPIATSDYFYGPLNQTCMSFTRSTPCSIPGIGKVREQMNQHTAFIDASHIYGYDDTHAAQLREHKRGNKYTPPSGRLLTNQVYKDFLPMRDQITKKHGEEALHDVLGLMVAGDHRTNVVPGLTALHTLFHREHNRLADQILKKDPEMDDELVFQHARRILIAEWQRIIYSELLPVMLGEEALKLYGLNISEGSSYTDYNANVDPRMFQGFTAGAYRFGQTLVNGFMLMMRDSEEIAVFRTRNSYFNNDMISVNRGEGYELILNGLMQQHSQTADRFITEDLTNYMWRPPGRPFGDDLVARNIQRARDHGVPAYDTYRKLCGLPALTTWEKPPPEIPRDNWHKLMQVYGRPQDIDLYPGGLSETPIPCGLAGPVFSCLLLKQLHAIKYGDRFFYTHRDQAGSFSPEQLAALNRVTFGDLICLNSDLKQTPRNVFRPVTESNPWVTCDDKNERLFLNIGLFL